MEERINILEKIGLKRIAIIVGIIFLVIIIYSVSVLISRIGKILVKVEYAPFAATVTINDIKLSNHAENYITPGEYHLKVEFENFETLEKEIEITEDTLFLAGALRAANDLGEAYVSSHQEEFVVIKNYADGVNGGDNERFFKIYPLLASFPITDPHYTIKYKLSEESKPIINVAVGTAYRQMAIYKLLDIMNDKDFETYDIYFDNLENPFAGTFEPNDETDPIKFIEKGFSNTGIDLNVNDGKQEGQYYSAYIRYFYQTYISIIYRVVLIQDSNGWRLVADPYPLLTTSNTPEVPLAILNRVNSL